MKQDAKQHLALVNHWLALKQKRFSRLPAVNGHHIECDCAGLITLLCDHCNVPKPYGLAHPRAVHYFAVLQETGSSHISQVAPGHVMAWRKDRVPKSGDSGHILLVCGEPIAQQKNVYLVKVIDSTRLNQGLAKRNIQLHTNDQGTLIGVQLHLSETKVKRTAIYHSHLLSTRYCLGCGVPKKLCLCQRLAVSQSTPPIIILRHPDERKQTLSTVSLIKQRYPEVLVKEGEQFRPMREENLALLFPGASKEGNTVLPNQTNAIERGAGDELKTKTLILLDATWRKAKRMLHENTWLSSLPRVHLARDSVSDYLLRKVPNDTALSTVEVFAMVQNDDLLQAHFRDFINQQIELMGRDKYDSNYRDHINYAPPR